MTDSMIERIAREIARSSALDDGKEEATASGFTDAVWPDFVPAARAVLTAMREPTGAIIKSMRDTVPVDGHEWEWVDDQAVPHWQAMIDAALAEAQPVP